MELKVTKVDFRKIDKGKMKSFARVTFNDIISIDGFKIIDGSKGLFVGMPSVLSGDKYYDTVYITDKKVKNQIMNDILKLYSGGSAPKKSENNDDDLPF